MFESFQKVVYSRYLFEYRYEGSDWALEIVAKSPNEARERLGALTWARYRGEVAAKVAVPGAGLPERIAAFCRQIAAIRSAR